MKLILLGTRCCLSFHTHSTVWILIACRGTVWARSQHAKRRLLASSCLPIRMLQLASYWTNFHKSWNCSKICWENSSLIKILQEWRVLYMKTCAFVISMWILLRMRNGFDKFSEKVTTHFILSIFSPEAIDFVCDNVEKKTQNFNVAFHCNSCYEKESQHDILRTLPILFCAIWLQLPLISNQRLQMKFKSQKNNQDILRSVALFDVFKHVNILHRQ
jgi:uncharacterized membrane protein